MSDYDITPSLQVKLATTEFLIRVVGEVVAEAKKNGDERWKVAAEQLQPLQDQRTSLLKLIREKDNLPEPEPIVIECTVGLSDAIAISLGS